MRATRWVRWRSTEASPAPRFWRAADVYPDGVLSTLRQWALRRHAFGLPFPPMAVPYERGAKVRRPPEKMIPYLEWLGISPREAHRARARSGADAGLANSETEVQDTRRVFMAVAKELCERAYDLMGKGASSDAVDVYRQAAVNWEAAAKGAEGDLLEHLHRQHWESRLNMVVAILMRDPPPALAEGEKGQDEDVHRHLDTLVENFVAEKGLGEEAERTLRECEDVIKEALLQLNCEREIERQKLYPGLNEEIPTPDVDAKERYGPPLQMMNRLVLPLWLKLYGAIRTDAGKEEVIRLHIDDLVRFLVAFTERVHGPDSAATLVAKGVRNRLRSLGITFGRRAARMPNESELFAWAMQVDDEGWMAASRSVRNRALMLLQDKASRKMAIVARPKYVSIDTPAGVMDLCTNEKEIHRVYKGWQRSVQLLERVVKLEVLEARGDTTEWRVVHPKLRLASLKFELGSLDAALEMYEDMYKSLAVDRIGHECRGHPHIISQMILLPWVTCLSLRARDAHVKRENARKLELCVKGYGLELDLDRAMALHEKIPLAGGLTTAVLPELVGPPTAEFFMAKAALTEVLASSNLKANSKEELDKTLWWYQKALEEKRKFRRGIDVVLDELESLNNQSRVHASLRNFAEAREQCKNFLDGARANQGELNTSFGSRWMNTVGFADVISRCDEIAQAGRGEVLNSDMSRKRDHITGAPLRHPPGYVTFESHPLRPKHPSPGERLIVEERWARRMHYNALTEEELEEELRAEAGDLFMSEDEDDDGS